MSVIFTRTGNKGVVTLDGDVTLPQAEELRRVLIKALVDADEVALDMEKVQNVDLSCLQLLCSAHRSASRFTKKLFFSGSPPKALKDAVEAAGFSRVTGCRLDCDKSCLWVALTGAHHG
jgi:anti-anti-sigma regulatory factor